MKLALAQGLRPPAERLAAGMQVLKAQHMGRTETVKPVTPSTAKVQPCRVLLGLNVLPVDSGMDWSTCAACTSGAGWLPSNAHQIPQLCKVDATYSLLAGAVCTECTALAESLSQQAAGGTW